MLTVLTVNYTHRCISLCTLHSFIAKLRASTLFYSFSLPPLSPTHSKTWVYSTHETASLLNIYFSSLSRALREKRAPLRCPAVCFCSLGKWLLNAVQTMIRSLTDKRAGVCHSRAGEALAFTLQHFIPLHLVLTQA